MRRIGWLLAPILLAAACGEEERQEGARGPMELERGPLRFEAPYLVKGDWLRTHRDEVVLVDMQKPENHERGHIPGAVHATVGDFRDDAKNLKPKEELERVLGRLGIDEDDHVVVYDDRGGMYATWLWYTLMQLGHRKVSILDGQLKAFDGPLAGGPGRDPEPKSYEARREPCCIVDADWVKAHQDEVLLIDARVPEQYTGERPKKGMKGGHPAGAVNVPVDTFIGEDGRYLDEEAARKRLRELIGEIPANRRIVLYCNSYRAASHIHFHLARLGVEDILAFEGSMKEWEAKGYPLKTGAQP